MVKEQPLPTDIKKKIEQALIRNAETDARQITVEVQGSKVILRGIVHAYAEKRAAEETAWSLPGVTEVENDISVVFPP
nr:BON domain-containing protein [Dictyobacter kobayashii]